MFILNEVEFVSALICCKITKYGWFYNKIQMWIEKNKESQNTRNSQQTFHGSINYPPKCRLSYFYVI